MKVPYLRVVLTALLVTACGSKPAAITPPPRCGDGKLDAQETCDDGNTADTDGCLHTCIPALCGDGVVNTPEGVSETCDDGNRDPGDACTNACRLATCGDGVLLVGIEACDDGNSVNTDGCSNACKLPTCGDGLVQKGEGCDDGNQDDSDVCLHTCVLASCGDGAVQKGEVCDDGNSDPTDGCSNACKVAACGDGIVRAEVEACDDGNVVDTDGCTNACALPSCGDGLVQKGEACDDGNQDDSDACLHTCVKAGCGDGAVQAGEACDDGNQDDHDACVSDCQAASCGDGIVQKGEACDDGNALDSDGCTSACKQASCGDGVAQKGEACDDGNADDADGCTQKCLLPACGDGVVQKGEACDDGKLAITGACVPGCKMATCGDGWLQAGVEACDGSAGCTGACKLASCGDGVVQKGEACDDGNQDEHDACLSSCLTAHCGDGVLLTGKEACDDGNQDDHDGCTAKCLSAFCGDGIVHKGVEACDDGNDVNTDGCTTACKPASCGDGVLQTGEQCDDGNFANSDTCLDTCVKASCGDGSVNAPGGTTETCDDGNQDAHDACLPGCVPAKCGDGVVQKGLEACDDGNQDDADGCTAKCKLASCGDGLVQTGEQCDDGNASNSDGCTGSCLESACGDGILNASAVTEACDDGNQSDNDACLGTCSAAKCGDGKLWLGKEACDDGNLTAGDGCSVDCKLANCGNGLIEAGEACDDGNTLDTDACTSLCLNATCGDGLVRAGVEACDDGNLDNGDGCNGNCQQVICGNGTVEPPEACDDGNALASDACLPICALAGCGDGIVWAGKEACDDGNASNTDACSNLCQAAKCGDGLVISGIEACDDGNASNSDACLNSCLKAKCGDGIVQVGVEPCDDGNGDNTDGCLFNCTVFDPCLGFAIDKVAPATACLGAVPSSVTLLGNGFLNVGGQKPLVTVDGSPVTVLQMLQCESTAFGQAQTCGRIDIALPAVVAQGPHAIEVRNVIGGNCPAQGVFTVTGPPTVTSVAPTPWCEGTTTFDILGSNFAAGSAVDFSGQVPNNVTLIDAGHLQVTFLNITPGTWNVSVANGAACSGSKASAVTVIAKPFLYFMDPAVVFSGVSVQGTVYASGYGDGVSKGKVTSVGVRIGGSGVAPKPLNFVYSPATAKIVTVTVPAGLADGTYEIVIADNLGCNVTLANAFVVTSKKTLALSGIDPPFAQAGVATAITLSTTTPLPAGQEAFQPVPTVYFSNAALGVAAPARSVGFLKADRLTAVTPTTLATGKYDVIVINPNGTVGVLASGLQVTAGAPASIDTVAPGSVPTTGVAVTILGSGFQTGSTVQLFCTPGSTTPTATVTPSAVSASSIAITTPGTLVAGSVCVVRVSQLDGTYAQFSALGVTAPSENLSDFEIAATGMNVARRGLGLTHGRATSSARFLYAIGGDGGSTSSATSSIEAVGLDAYGGSGDWRVLPTALPGARTFLGAATVGRYVYAFGGNDGTSAKAEVFRAQILDPAEAPRVSDLAIDLASSGLGAGVWTYRVAARLAPGDARNPNGIGLPSDPVTVRVPAGLTVKLQPSLTWTAVAGAQSYLLYRSPTAGATVGQEQLLAELPGTAFTDIGGATQPGTPRQLGDLGAWKQAPSLDLPRESLGVAVAADPVTAGQFYLYAVLGRTLGAVLVPTVAYLPVSFDAAGAPIEPAAWKIATQKPDVPRCNLSVATVDRTVTNRLAAPTDVWLYVGSGSNGAGSGQVNELDAAKVQAGGDLSAFSGLASSFKNRWGYAGFAAANQVFALGGAAGLPSSGGVSGQLCGLGGPCSGVPGVQNINAGISLATARVFMGVALESGRIWIVGGQGAAGALKTVESTIW